MNAAKPRKVIYDTDPGVDDAMALYFALAHPAIDLVGITTTFGNVTVEQAATADTAISTLMGDDVEARKEFIKKNAKDVRFIDI